MKILITGACGFAGSTIAEAWLKSTPGLSIIGLDNLTRPGSEINRRKLQQLGISFFHGDIRSAADLESLPKVDWVLDAAANPSVLAGVDGRTSSRQLVEHNLQGTVNLLEYCKRVGAGFILLSTSRVYSIRHLAAIPVETRELAFHPAVGADVVGFGAEGLTEEFSTTPPLSLYGTSKLASELLALEYGDTFAFPVWINRCGILAGAGQFGRIDQGIVAFWINSWLRRRPLAYIGFGGSGHQVRDCLHPADLVPLLNRQMAATAAPSDRIFNLGGGADNTFSLAELSRWCEARFGSHTVSRQEETRRFDIPWLVMDSGKAGKTWGWQPQTRVEAILDEIAGHAEQNHEWLELSENN